MRLVWTRPVGSMLSFPWAPGSSTDSFWDIYKLIRHLKQMRRIIVTFPVGGGGVRLEGLVYIYVDEYILGDLTVIQGIFEQSSFPERNDKSNSLREIASSYKIGLEASRPAVLNM